VADPDRTGQCTDLGTVRDVNLCAVWLGKLTLLALRMIGRRGNALPGLVVEKVFPRYLARAMSSLPEGVVVVTGTNGKTTTTKMVSTVLGENLRVLTNDTGSNFVRGAITATDGRRRATATGQPLPRMGSPSSRYSVAPQRAHCARFERDRVARCLTATPADP